jgi:YesN/AraC family two-component response regulator
MMKNDDIIYFNSVTAVFNVLGLGKPQHPLIGVVDAKVFNYRKEYLNVKTVSNLYYIILKDGDCGMQYGRNQYDFEEGVLRFLAPNQVLTVTESVDSSYGFVLFFHPDLIRNFPLGKEIDRYSFFDYAVHEALHLSHKEEKILIDCVKNIEFELGENIDKHSQELLVSNLQLLLNYSKRFYERQFITRANSNSDVVSKVEQALKKYYQEEKQLETGLPSTKYFAEEVNLSANYLSDLLKKETGKNTKEHVDDYIVNLAKTQLLNSNDNVSEIAFNLGFNYPHYFSRLFKKKTGETPNAFRAKHYN